ncbi:hypothetical protein [Mycobacterium sp. OTB74]|uniref:hypothetical protein n=1 Tax=Mycobacterium sp. OTB74 TaxID=1853452 RepID=UPI002474E09D|nr:hypothetical protein [Mycobacterium sp. OTB74]MDH6243339.1 hypothetical protein [Mycobacterium sp. OTB74]
MPPSGLIVIDDGAPGLVEVLVDEVLPAEVEMLGVDVLVVDEPVPPAAFVLPLSEPVLDVVVLDVPPLDESLPEAPPWEALPPDPAAPEEPEDPGDDEPPPESLLGCAKATAVLGPQTRKVTAISPHAVARCFCDLTRRPPSLEQSCSMSYLTERQILLFTA